MTTVPPSPPPGNAGPPKTGPAFVATKPGPQAVNRIAATFAEQLARALGPRPWPTTRDAELAELRRQVRFLLGAVYGSRRGGSAV